MDALSKLVDALTTSDGSTPPPFSKAKIAVAISVVAAAVFGWRYAPKLTLTLVAGASFYYGAKSIYSWYFFKPKSDDLIEEDSKPPQDDLPPPSTDPVQPLPSQTEVTPVTTLSSLEEVTVWIEQLLANSSSPPDIFPVLSCLWTLKPAEVSKSLDCIYYFGSPEYMAKAQSLIQKQMSNDPKAWIMGMLAETLKDPQEAETLLKSPAAQTMANQLGISLSELPEYIKTLQQKHAQNPGSNCSESVDEMEAFFKGAKEKTAPTIRYMMTVFSLCAALEGNPSPLTNFAHRLKTREASEEGLQDKEFRQFILQIIYLSRYTEFDTVLKQINPTKIEENKKNFTTHPLNLPQSFGLSFYTHWIALQAWYKITKADFYLQAMHDLPNKAANTETTTLEEYQLFSILGPHLMQEITDYLEKSNLKTEPQPVTGSLATSNNSSSLENIRVWASQALGNQPLERNLISIFSELFQLKPQGITDVIFWSPPIPGSERFTQLTQLSSDQALSLLEPVLSNPNPSLGFFQLYQQVFQKRNACLDKGVKALLDEAEFMNTVYCISLTLQKHLSLAHNFLEEFKLHFAKDTRPEKSPFTDKSFRLFVLSILWLSQHPEATAFATTRFTLKTLPTLVLPESSTSTFGPDSYRWIIASSLRQQFFPNDKQQKDYLAMLLNFYKQSWEVANDASATLTQGFIHLTVIKKLATNLQCAVNSLSEQVKNSQGNIPQTVLSFCRYLYLIKPGDMTARNWSLPIMGSEPFMTALKTKKSITTAKEAYALIEDPTMIAEIVKEFAPTIEISQLFIQGAFQLSALAHHHREIQIALKQVCDDNSVSQDADQGFTTFLSDIHWLATETQNSEHPLNIDLTTLSLKSIQSLFALASWWVITNNPDYKNKIASLKQIVEAYIATFKIAIQSLSSVPVEDIEDILSHYLVGLSALNFIQKELTPS